MEVRIFHLWEPDRSSPRRRLADSPLRILYPLLSRLVLYFGKRDKNAPQIARLAQMPVEIPSQLQQRIAGCGSARPTAQRTAHSWMMAKSG